MSFRKILYGILTIWLALAGIAFGALFVLCVSLYLLWHGLSVSVFVFGMLDVTFIALACLALRRMMATGKMRLPDADPARLTDGIAFSFSDSATEKARESLRRH